MLREIKVVLWRLPVLITGFLFLKTRASIFSRSLSELAPFVHVFVQVKASYKRISLKNKHTWYITASLFHWNIKVYIYLLLSWRERTKSRKELVASVVAVFFNRQKKKKRSGLKNRKATVPGCHRFVHIWGREANSRTWIHTHLHPHTSTHRSVVSPTFLKPCSPLYPWTRCEKSTVIISWTWSSGSSIFMVCVLTSTGGLVFKVLLWR